MNLIRRSVPQFALLVLAILGIADAIYLTIVHYDTQVTLVCSGSGFVNCERVITSSYSYVPGTSIPISLPGLAWCVVLGALALAGLFTDAERLWLRLAEFIWTLLGLLTVFYLFYVEVVRLDNLCAWCTVLHVLILLTFLIALTQLRGHSAEYDEELDDEGDDAVVRSESGRTI